jgi:hypothetical protein
MANETLADTLSKIAEHRSNLAKYNDDDLIARAGATYAKIAAGVTELEVISEALSGDTADSLQAKQVLLQIGNAGRIVPQMAKAAIHRIDQRHEAQSE